MLAVIAALGFVIVAAASTWLLLVAGRADVARGRGLAVADSDVAEGLRRTAGVVAFFAAVPVSRLADAATLAAGLRAAVVFDAGTTSLASDAGWVTRAAVLRGAGFGASLAAESALRVTRRRGAGSGGRSSLMTEV